MRAERTAITVKTETRIQLYYFTSRLHCFKLTAEGEDNTDFTGCDIIS